MQELNKIGKMLDAAFVPREVWIGTDSTADRVEWLIKRNQTLKERASKRFDTFSDEFMVLAMLDNFEKEDLTVDEIARRSGLERDVVKTVVAYLAQKGLIFEYNDGLKGMLYYQSQPAAGAETEKL